MGRVIPHQRRKIEGHRETAAAMLEQVIAALVGLLRRGESRELPHGKKLAAISGSVNAARERRLTRISKILVVIPVLGKIGLRVQPPDGRAGNSREARMPVLIEIDARTRSNRLLRSFFERGCKRLFRPLL